jgi:sugar fermentation stimulation protein A
MPAPRVQITEPIVWGRFVRRYKRFFVDVEVDGAVVTAHTANTGAMTGLLVEGAPVILTRHDKPSRKLPLEVEAIYVGTSWVVVNTIRANRVARAFVEGGAFPELGTTVDATEVKVGDSRIDMQVAGRLVEVKSITLRDGDRAIFPDAKSVRATKHATTLESVARADGRSAAALFLCQRTDVDSVAPADAIDPDYGRALRRARDAGVSMLAASVGVDVDGDDFAATSVALRCASRLVVEFPG